MSAVNVIGHRVAGGISRRRARLARAALVAGAVGLLLAVGGASASAASPYVDGISDQDMGQWSGNFVERSNVFNAPFYDYFPLAWVGRPGAQHIQYARFVTAPDAVHQGGACLQNLFNWLRYVMQAHLTPVIAVWNVAEGGCANDGRPSTAAYTSDIQQLLHYLDGLYPGTTVPYLETWNEPNVSGVSATEAAAYWTAANALCASDGCTAIAGDFVDNNPDQGSQAFNPGCKANLTYNRFLKPYEAQYVTALGSARPAIWGFHPYYAVNCEQSASVTTFESNLPSPSGQVWFTEVGAWECRLGQSTARGVTRQNQDAAYLVNTLMPGTAPSHVFYYELAPLVYTQSCKKYADSALYEANTAPGDLLARPAATAIYGPDSSLAATTGSSVRITPTTASLGGTLTPGGIYEGQYSFQYGPTTAYGSQTPALQLGPALVPRPVSVTVAGLIPNMAYHYQLILADPGGLVRRGADQVLGAASPSVSAATAAFARSGAVLWTGLPDQLRF